MQRVRRFFLHACAAGTDMLHLSQITGTVPDGKSNATRSKIPAAGMLLGLCQQGRRLRTDSIFEQFVKADRKRRICWKTQCARCQNVEKQAKKRVGLLILQRTCAKIKVNCGVKPAKRRAPLMAERYLLELMKNPAGCRSIRRSRDRQMIDKEC